MTDNNQKFLTLDDTVIGHIAKLLQISLLTGTDIIDHMRMIRLDPKEGKVCLEDSYNEEFNGSLDMMLKRAQEEYQGEE